MTTKSSSPAQSLPMPAQVQDWYPELTNLDTTLAYLCSNGAGPDLLAWGADEELSLDAKDVKSFQLLQEFHDRHGWVFGFLGYDLKNSLEALESSNTDRIGMPDGYFFKPVNLWKRDGGSWTRVIGAAEFPGEASKDSSGPVELFPILKKEDYLRRIKECLEHIHYGDVYELNFCHEFMAEGANIEPYEVWKSLNNITRAPFSCYLQFQDKHLMCASPERFIQKQGSRVISQPIKGTTRRGENEIEDEALKNKLITSDKERQENIMITDLVRNDLSKTALPGSVNVDELCGVYSFNTVHQLISTVSSQVDANTPVVDIIKAAFPMGSMTGAPKIRAMELIEKLESMKRGIYSGAVGYLNSRGDFDFNVVIRSLMYNRTSKHLSAMVGGAITAESDPEAEYEETLLKVRALQQALSDAE